MIDTTTDDVAAVIPTLGTNGYLSFSPDSRFAYLSEGGAGSESAHLGLVWMALLVVKAMPGDGDIRIVDTDTFRQIGPRLPGGKSPTDVATTMPGLVSGS